MGIQFWNRITIIVITITLSLTAGAHPLDEVEAHPPIRVHQQGTSGPTGYNPSQIRHAYGFDQLPQKGSGQTIAIIDAYGNPYIQSDTDTFSKQFGLPTTQVKVLYPQGKPKRIDSGWALETSLDVEWAHAIAPGATILLVVSKSASLGDLLGAVTVAVNQGANQISMSWGGSEFSTESSYDSYFNHTGVSFFASSGDNGTGVIWPAVSPFVVGVGGTTLNLDVAGNVLSETAWSGSGGGISPYVAEPGYQTQWQSTGRRGVPDVSYDADPQTGFPVYDSYSCRRNCWSQVGGTSAGAPQWAAAVALANSARASSLDSVNSILYYFGSPSNQTTYFRDIIFGCNGSGATSIDCAQSGYDFVTGVGSPLGNTLIPALMIY